MRETILITGSSGLAGGLLLDRFLDLDVRLLLTKHTSAPRSRRGRAEVEMIACDLTERHFGLAQSDLRRMATEVTAILHCAGLTEFSATRAAARHANVQAMEHLLNFARMSHRLRRIGILSTVYVAGRRRGIVSAGELTHRAGFVNEYERSKYEAEQLVRDSMRRLPLSVYRLSTLLCSRRGMIPRLGAIHQALRLFHAGLIPIIPGEASSAVDLITTDYACDALDILFTSFEPGATHHIVAGAGNRIALADFLERTAALFATLDRRWMAHDFETPPIAALRTFERLRRSVELVNDPVLTEVMTMMSRFVPQLAYPKVFDDESTRAILRHQGVAEDRLESVYPRFIRNAVESRWGKRSQGST
jgi:nucleoside-diphosphate-sugar epimerase